ncbi:MAG: beta-N-acetylglucosaminidase [Balneola sp.]|nr:MAG: beta-N-acetylglucosaminidase [Balneola sp.]
MRHLLLFCILLLNAQFLSAYQSSEISIIPKPVHMEEGQGSFSIEDGITIFYSDPSLEGISTQLNDLLFVTNWKGYEVISGTESNDKGIYLSLMDSEDIHPEGYELEVSESKITIKGSTAAGVFYGIQTLRQLLPEQIEHTDPSLVTRDVAWNIPVVEIQDFPRFQYRGMHLDVARHFFPVEFVKRYIDLIAMYKYNRFHWHLTEDQGWRIEIKQYPLLTEIGAWRDSTLIGNYGTGKYDGIRYGGYYTQDEIREIVAYAKERYVTVIPEIELPGHSTAAIAAYPELGCFNQDIDVATTWGVFEDIYCPKEETFEFLENVLDEVIELFPSTYIHIGGDEAPKKQWEESEVAQEVIQREGLADEHELQSYFITRIESYLNSKGRQIIGWDEILEGGLAPRATVMSWRGEQGGIEAAKMGHNVIMTPNGSNYFDHYQAENEREPIAICCLTTLEDIYGYEPVPAELNEEESRYVLGAQGNVWTEYMHTGAKVEYMAFPRVIGLSEVLWTPKSDKEWERFLIRLQSHFLRMDYLNVNAAQHYRD